MISLMERGTSRPKVVIVGAGFGGLRTAHRLSKLPVDVTLVDARNYHTFQPLLYQVATAALDTEAIAHTVRGMFQHERNVAFRMAEAQGVDWEGKRLIVDCCEPIPFDYIVFAAGTVTNDFGIEGVAQNAFGLKSIEEAVALRSHIMCQFELADADPALIEQGALTFVIVGGGPTGVEMAGAMVEWIDRVLRKDFPRLDVSRSKVILLEALDKLLAPFDPTLQKHALNVLTRRGVDVRLNTAVTQVTPDAVHLKSGEIIPTCTVIWGAGVKAHPIAGKLGVEQSRGGRIVVNPDLSIPSKPFAFVIGDLAMGKNPDGTPHPQLAQAALQGGAHVATQIARLMRDEPAEPMVYKDPGFMATIGRSAGVAQFPNGWKFKGFIGWFMWLFLHLVFLVGFRNRAVVFITWMYSYFTYDRSARLIFAPALAERRT
jgi:NADH dehydrogenase